MRTVISIKLRIKPLKRRSPSQRLKARLYYRRNRSKIRLQRRRYIRTHKNILKHRKMFMRYKPSWFKKPSKHKKLKSPKFKVKTFKVKKPKQHRIPGITKRKIR